MWNHGYLLKFFRFLVNSIAVNSQSIDSIAEWQQPTYWQALTAVAQSRSKWGHPVGIRAAATWNLCPALEIPPGVKDVTCSGATCMQICEDGKAAMGRRRVKCRWKRKKGFFWKKVSSWNDIRLHQTNSRHAISHRNMYILLEYYEFINGIFYKAIWVINLIFVGSTVY